MPTLKPTLGEAPPIEPNPLLKVPTSQPKMFLPAAVPVGPQQAKEVPAVVSGCVGAAAEHEKQTGEVCRDCGVARSLHRPAPVPKRVPLRRLQQGPPLSNAVSNLPELVPYVPQDTGYQAAQKYHLDQLEADVLADLHSRGNGAEAEDARQEVEEMLLQGRRWVNADLGALGPGTLERAQRLHQAKKELQAAEDRGETEAVPALAKYRLALEMMMQGQDVGTLLRTVKARLNNQEPQAQTLRDCHRTVVPEPSEEKQSVGDRFPEKTCERLWRENHMATYNQVRMLVGVLGDANRLQRKIDTEDHYINDNTDILTVNSFHTVLNCPITHQELASLALGPETPTEPDGSPINDLLPDGLISATPFAKGKAKENAFAPTLIPGHPILNDSVLKAHGFDADTQKFSIPGPYYTQKEEEIIVRDDYLRAHLDNQPIPIGANSPSTASGSISVTTDVSLFGIPNFPNFFDPETVQLPPLFTGTNGIPSPNVNYTGPSRLPAAFPPCFPATLHPHPKLPHAAYIPYALLNKIPHTNEPIDITPELRALQLADRTRPIELKDFDPTVSPEEAAKYMYGRDANGNPRFSVGEWLASEGSRLWTDILRAKHGDNTPGVDTRYKSSLQMQYLEQEVKQMDAKGQEMAREKYPWYFGKSAEMLKVEAEKKWDDEEKDREVSYGKEVDGAFKKMANTTIEDMQRRQERAKKANEDQSKRYAPLGVGYTHEDVEYRF